MSSRKQRKDTRDAEESSGSSVREDRPRERQQNNAKRSESRSPPRKGEQHTDVAKRPRPKLTTWDLYTLSIRSPKKKREIIERYQGSQRREGFEKDDSARNDSVSDSLRSDSTRSESTSSESTSSENTSSENTSSYKTARTHPERCGRESGLHTEFKIPERLERSPPISEDSSVISMASMIYGSYEYDPEKADIGALPRPSKRAPRTPWHANIYKSLKSPEKPRIIVNPGDSELKTNDSFISIEAKICTTSNFFIVITKKYSLMLNIPNHWGRTAIIDKLAAIYHSLGNYRKYEPIEPGCMWLIKGVYNDFDRNRMASLVNVHRYRFLTELITNTDGFNWDHGELQHGSFVHEHGQGEPRGVYSIGVFAQPDGPPRLQVTDCEGTHYLRADSESSSNSVSGNNSTNPLSDSAKNTPKPINDKNGTPPINDPSKINPKPAASDGEKRPDPLSVNPDENTQKKTTSGNKEGTNASTFNPTKSTPKPANDKKNTNPLSDTHESVSKATTGKKNTNPPSVNPDENTQKKTPDGKKGNNPLSAAAKDTPKPAANDKKTSNPPAVNPNENTQKKITNSKESTNNSPGFNPAKSPLNALNNNNKKGKKKAPPKPTCEDAED